MREATTPYADEGDVEFVAGGVLSEQRAGDHAAGDKAGSTDEAAT
jgi:hypothetical protein